MRFVSLVRKQVAYVESANLSSWYHVIQLGKSTSPKRDRRITREDVAGLLHLTPFGGIGWQT